MIFWNFGIFKTTLFDLKHFQLRFEFITLQNFQKSIARLGNQLNFDNISSDRANLHDLFLYSSNLQDPFSFILLRARNVIETLSKNFRLSIILIKIIAISYSNKFNNDKRYIDKSNEINCKEER